MSRVTAIISAYYAEPYLEGRIDNLLEQDERPRIVAVCQEGSAEQRILDQHKGITTILTPDIPSVYQAWNMGIKAATTPYITNANSDDRLYPGALRKMADVLDKESTYGVVYSDIDITDKIDGGVVSRFQWMEGGLKELLRGCFLGPMPMWRKKLHNRFGYFDESYVSAADYEFWLRIANGGVKFYHVRGDPLGVYLKRQNSVEHREPLRSLWEANNIRMKYREVANA